MSITPLTTQMMAYRTEPVPERICPVPDDLRRYIVINYHVSPDAAVFAYPSQRDKYGVFLNFPLRIFQVHLVGLLNSEGICLWKFEAQFNSEHSLAFSVDVVLVRSCEVICSSVFYFLFRVQQKLTFFSFRIFVVELSLQLTRSVVRCQACCDVL